MSIQDHSIMTEYVARGLCTTGEDSLKDFTGGYISDSDENRVMGIIQSELNQSSWQTTGNVPNSVYTNVATELERYTPGMDRFTIVNVLKTNNLFGQSGKVTVDVDAEGLTSSVQEYDNKVNSVQSSYDQFRSKNMTSGYGSDAINELGREGQDTLQRITRRIDDKIRIDRKLTTAVNSIMSGVPNVLYSSMPSGARSVLRDMINRGQVRTVTIGKAISLGGGGSVTLSGGGIDINKGDFAVDFASLTQKERATVSAKSVIEETGVDPASEEALAKEIHDSEMGTTLASNSGRYNVVNSDPIQIGEGNIVPGTNYISSVEELEYEMGSMTREISEVIVHWSETYTNANLSAESLEELTGAGKNSYHLIIKRDGSVQRGVAMNAVGDHCDINNHNAYSIGVCMIGGVNVSTGDNELEQLGANSLTRSQFNSLYQIFRTFFNHYPGGQALGHMDVDVSQDDPGFDVRDYVYNNFNKTSLYTDPLNQAALSPSDILASLERNETVVQKDPDVMDKRF